MEIWKDIRGYENLYQVSDLGRVRSKDKVRNYANKSTYFRKGKVLKNNICGNKNEQYLYVRLTKNKKEKDFKVHRLVALHFIEYNENKVINHLDRDTFNNKVTNLELTTVRANNVHKSRANNKTPGVNFCNKRNKFRARAVLNKKEYHLGYFNCREKAYKSVIHFKNKNGITTKYD